MSSPSLIWPGRASSGLFQSSDSVWAALNTVLYESCNMGECSFLPGALSRHLVESDVFVSTGSYAPFLKEDFDVQSHVSQLVQGMVITEHLNKLTLGRCAIIYTFTSLHLNDIRNNCLENIFVCSCM